MLGPVKGALAVKLFAAGIFFFGGVGIGLYLLIEACFVKIIFDDTLVISYSPWRRDIWMIPWDDIESVKYSKIMQG